MHPATTVSGLVLYDVPHRRRPAGGSLTGSRTALRSGHMIHQIRSISMRTPSYPVTRARARAYWGENTVLQVRQLPSHLRSAEEIGDIKIVRECIVAYVPYGTWCRMACPIDVVPGSHKSLRPLFLRICIASGGPDILTVPYALSHDRALVRPLDSQERRRPL